VFKNTGDLVAADRSCILIVMPEGSKGSRRPLQQTKAAKGSYPDLPVCIFPQPFYIIADKARSVSGAMDKMFEPARRIHPVEPSVFRSYPQRTPPLLQQTQDPVARKAVRVGRIMSEMGKLIRPAIIAIEPPSPGTDPE